MSKDKNDPLTTPLAQLEQVLSEPHSGRERDWADRVADALGAFEAGLRQHECLAGTPNGLFAGVDLGRPTFIRQMNGLRLQIADFLREVRELRGQLRQAAQAFQPPHLLGSMDRLPAPVARAAVPHFGELRRGVGGFLGRLRRHRDEETRLVLESVTTDIGAGD